MLKIATKQPAQHCRQTSLLHNQTKCAFLLVTFPHVTTESVVTCGIS